MAPPCTRSIGGAAGTGGQAGSGNGGQAGSGAAGSNTGGTGNTGGDACVSETVEQLCSAKNASCGQISGSDSCNLPYNVDCGPCGCGETCTSNLCVGACSLQPGQSGCTCDGMCGTAVPSRSSTVRSASV